MDKSTFLAMEAESHDTIDVKRVYVEMCNKDLVAGVLLSQIIYWHLPPKRGNRESKLRVWLDNDLWLAKNRTDWWAECCISEWQYDRAIKVLEEKGYVTVRNSMFNGKRTPFIRLLWDKFLQDLETAVNGEPTPVLVKPQDRYEGNTNTGISETPRPITEITSKNTTVISEKANAIIPPLELRTLPIGAGGLSAGKGDQVRKEQLARDRAAKREQVAEAKAALDAMDGRVRAALEAFMVGTANGGKPSPILPQFIDKHGQAARDMIQAGYMPEQIGQAAKWFYEKWAGKYTLTPTNMAANMNQWANGNGGKGHSLSLQSSLSLGLE